MNMSDMTVWLQFAGSVAAAGMLAGFLGGLLGGGGGMVVIPVLYHVFGAMGVDASVRMHLVIGTSLAAVLPLSILGTRSHSLQGNVDWPLVGRLAPAALIGSLAAGFMGHRMGAHALAWVFAAVAVATVCHMLMPSRSMSSPEAGGRPGPALLGAPALGAIGAGIGCVSTLVGIGGATLTVPVLHLLGKRMRSAVGTSSVLGMAIAFPGAVSFALAGKQVDHLPPGSLGYVNVLGAVLLFIFGSAGVRAGARLTKRTDERVLRAAFCLLVVATAVRMVVATA